MAGLFGLFLGAWSTGGTSPLFSPGKKALSRRFGNWKWLDKGENNLLEITQFQDLTNQILAIPSLSASCDRIGRRRKIYKNRDRRQPSEPALPAFYCLQVCEAFILLLNVRFVYQVLSLPGFKTSYKMFFISLYKLLGNFLTNIESSTSSISVSV